MTRILTIVLVALIAATGQALAGASVLTVNSLTPAGIAAVSVYKTQGGALLATCNPTTTNPTCLVQGLSDGDTPYFVVGTNAGYNVIGGTGMCAGISGPNFSATVPSGTSALCGIQTTNAPVVLNITAGTPAAVNAITVYRSYDPVARQTGAQVGSCAPTVAQPTCVFTGGLQPGDNPYVVVESTIGWGITGGSGQCASVRGSPFLIGTLGSTVYNCGLTSAANVLSVTSLNPAGIASIQVYKSQGGALLSTCTPSPGAPNCSVGGLAAGDKPYFVLGVNAGYGVSGGTGLCSAVTGTTFALAALPAGGGWTCGLNSVTAPQNGWWYANDGSGNGYAFSIDSTTQYLYGVAFTYRTDGSPVWYAINAMANSSNVYVGTASEFTGGPSLTGTAGASRLKSIVANIQLGFTSGTAGNLTWTPRVTGTVTPTVKALQRFPINGTSVLPPPANAPVTGWYQGAQYGSGYFLELQGTSAPQAHLGIYAFDAQGNATWAASGNTTALATTGGWQVTTPFYTYSGGAPLTTAAPVPTPAPTGLGTVIGNLSPTTNSLTLWNSQTVTLNPYIGFGPTAGNWLQVINQNTASLPAPYVAFNSTKGLVYFVDATKNTFTQVQDLTSYPLSNVANGSFFIASTGIGGRMFVSAQPMSFPGGALPNPNNPADQNNGFRWQFLEVGGDYDLSYVDLYSIPMAFNQGTLIYGAATPAHLATLVSTLSGLTTPANAAVQYDNNNKLLRILSPAGSTDVAKYPSLSTYISGTNFANLTISDSYNGVAAASIPTNAACGNSAFAGQAYATTSITYDGVGGVLTIKGNTTIPNQAAVPFTIVASAQSSVQTTTSLTPQAFSNAVYMGEMDYTVTSATCSASTQTENNGANDVFSVVIRDILAGFSVGYVGSATYGTLPSSAWWGSSTIFSGLQPASTAAAPLYNPWAAVVYSLFRNNVYGFQYSDHFTTLGSPLVPIQPGSPLQLILLNETTN